MPIIYTDDCAPDWRNAPPSAEWWCVDANGAEMYSVHEPQPRGWFWLPTDEHPNQNRWFTNRIIRIPEGVDWRTLKQRRPKPGQEEQKSG